MQKIRFPKGNECKLILDRSMLLLLMLLLIFYTWRIQISNHEDNYNGWCEENIYHYQAERTKYEPNQRPKFALKSIRFPNFPILHI